MTIITPENWKEAFFGVKQKEFPPNHSLREDEENLINELLTPEPENRPNDLEEIIDVADYLIENHDGIKSF